MFFIVTTLVYLNMFFNNSFPPNFFTELVLNYSLTKTIFSDFQLTGVKQAWTLTLEEMFYIMAPFLFLWIRKKKIWLFLTLALILVLGTSLHEYFKNVEGTGGFLHQNIFLYFIEFFGGVGLALLHRKYKTHTRYLYTSIGSIVILLFLLTHRQLDPLELGESLEQFIKISVLTVFGIMPLFWGLINEKNWLQSILSTKLFLLLGKSSYIFYLIHKGFIPNFIYDHLSENTFVIFIVLNIISILMFIYIEEPLNSNIRKWFKKKNSALQAQVN